VGTTVTDYGGGTWGRPSRGTLAAAAIVLAVAIAGLGWIVWSHTHSSTPEDPWTGRLGAAALDRSTGRVEASGTLTNALSHPVKFQVWYTCIGSRRVMPFRMRSAIITLDPGRSTAWTIHSPVLRLKSNAKPVPRSRLAHMSNWENCAMMVRTPGISY
jgi:hypothetical protein